MYELIDDYNRVTVTRAGDYMGLPIQSELGDVVLDYLKPTYSLLEHMYGSHARVFIAPITIQFPEWMSLEECLSEDWFGRFAESLRSKLATYEKHCKAYGNYNVVDFKYIRCTEVGVQNGRLHYHAVLMFNGNAFRTLGSVTSTETNLWERIEKAWSSALHKLDPIGLVHFSNTHLVQRTNDFNSDCYSAFYHMSYLSKLHTKAYGLGIKVFTTSRIPKSTS